MTTWLMIATVTTAWCAVSVILGMVFGALVDEAERADGAADGCGECAAASSASVVELFRTHP